MKRLFILCALLVATGCTETKLDTAIQGIDSSGRLIVINYWAEWCKPCVKEIPELNQFAEHHKDSVLLLGVNFDNLKGEALTAANTKLGIAFQGIQDPAATLGFERPTVLPTTVILTSDKRYIGTLVGPQTEDSLRQAIQLAEREIKAR